MKALRVIGFLLVGMGAMCAAFGGVLQKWTCETSEISTHDITAYRGETVKLQCQMLSYGRVVSNYGKAEFLWQTNGMDTAWWVTNATCDSMYIYFKWTPQYDCGEDRYRFFFRVTDSSGANYRANGTMNLIGSPSGDVRYLPLPQKIIDFNQTTILNATNAPWLIKGSDVVVPSQVTNIAEYVVSTNNFATSSITNGLATTNYVNAAVKGVTPGGYSEVSNKAYTAMSVLNAGTNIWYNKQDVIADYTTTQAVKQVIADEGYLKSYTEKDPTVALSNDTVYASGTNRTFQPLLISGTNIVTINGTSLLQSGNLVIGGGSGTNDYEALSNLPKIGDKEIKGNKTIDYYGGQTSLTPTQTNAVDSGITSAKVATYDGYATNKQDRLAFEIVSNGVSVVTNYTINVGYATDAGTAGSAYNSECLCDATNDIYASGLWVSITNEETQAAITNRISSEGYVDNIATSVISYADKTFVTKGGSYLKFANVNDSTLYITNAVDKEVVKFIGGGVTDVRVDGTSVVTGRIADINGLASTIWANDTFVTKAGEKIVIGSGAYVEPASEGVAIGKNAKVNFTGATTAVNYGTAVGSGTTASGLHATALGSGGIVASGEKSTAVGNSSQATGLSSTAIGFWATARAGATSALGGNSHANFLRSTAVGWAATTDATNATAVGSALVMSNAMCAVAIGSGAMVGVGATNAVQLGEGINTNANTIQFMNHPLAYKSNISHTDADFTNAVFQTFVSGVDTNSIAILKELSGIPLEGTGGTLAAIIAAIIGSIVWMKKKKLDMGTVCGEWDKDVAYAKGANVVYNGKFYTSKEDTNKNHSPTDTTWWDESTLFSGTNTLLMGTIRYALASSDCTVSEDDEVELADRTTNQFTMNASGETYTFAFPDAVSGKVREFKLHLTYTAGMLQLPSDIESVGDTLSFTATKSYLLAFTEIGTKTVSGTAKPLFYIRSIQLD